MGQRMLLNLETHSSKYFLMRQLLGIVYSEGNYSFRCSGEDEFIALIFQMLRVGLIEFENYLETL